MLESKGKSGNVCSRGKKSLANINKGKEEDKMCSKTDLHSFEGPGGRTEKGGGQGEGS